MTQPNHKELIARLEGWIDALNEAESFSTHAVLPIMRECLTALEARPVVSEEKARAVLASVMLESRGNEICARLVRDGNEHAALLDGDDVIRAMIRFATDTQPVAGGGEDHAGDVNDMIATTDRAIVLEEAIKDANVVHLNMLRGGIAKPSHAQIWHLYGGALAKDMPEHVRAALSEQGKA